jgi:hypothetical protein
MDTLMVNRGHYMGQAHEVASSARYAAHIQRRFGERLVLIPAVYDRSVPGYDGFVRDASGNAVANYSLKNIMGGVPSSIELVDLVRRAIKKGYHYSRALAWLVDYAMVSVDHYHLADEERINLVKKHWRHDELGVLRRHELAMAMRLFHVHADSHLDPRPLRVVIDLGGRGMALPVVELGHLMADYREYLEEITMIAPARISRFYRDGDRVRVVHYSGM